MWRSGSYHEEDGARVALEDPVISGWGRFGERCVEGDAGVVDEDVDLINAKGLEGVLDNALGVVSYVCLDGGCGGAGVFDRSDDSMCPLNRGGMVEGKGNLEGSVSW